MEVDARDAQPHGVAKRDVDHRLALERIIVAIFGLGGGFERPELGLGGDHIDHARGRVAAEQRALRSAQHFAAFEVEEFGLDRKSVVSGKSVSVRVDLGGRSIFKKKNKKN